MKRQANLMSKILDRENLRRAVWFALRGKRNRSDAQQFVGNLNFELNRISKGLRTGTFLFGVAQQFTIYDPKQRIITAPCFADRVVHHAIMNVCGLWFDRWLVDHSFACRVGKGRSAALNCARDNSRRYGWYLKLDIRRYFDSISHEVLKSLLQHKFKDRQLLATFGQIIDSHGKDGRGLPIGSLMSQHFANAYLDRFDRLVKEVFRIPGFARYMDDSVLWSDDREVLKNVLPQIRQFLLHDLRLELKPYPYINRTQHGVDFLGARVFGTHLILNRRSRRRFSRRLNSLRRCFEAGEISEDEYQHRASSVFAYARADNVSSWNFRTAMLERPLVHSQKPARTA